MEEPHTHSYHVVRALEVAQDGAAVYSSRSTAVVRKEDNFEQVVEDGAHRPRTSQGRGAVLVMEVEVVAADFVVESHPMAASAAVCGRMAADSVAFRDQSSPCWSEIAEVVKVVQVAALEAVELDQASS